MKLTAWVACGIFLLVAVSKIYVGTITQPTEGDSLAYHIPIAQIIVDGDFWNREKFRSPFYYYPAWGETILAGFMKLGIPLNLFNVVGWTLFTGTCWLVAKRRGLAPEARVVFAVSMGLLPAVVRLVANQTIDIWLAVWFMWIVAFGEKVKRSKTDYFWMGASMGMLVGTKYSGGLFGGALVIAYYQIWRKEINWRRLVAFGIPAVVMGGWWYFRNWMMIGNPVYPLSLLGWQGSGDFVLENMTIWKIIVMRPGNWCVFGGAVVSEYLIWSLVVLVGIKNRSRMVVLGFLGLAAQLWHPISLDNPYSGMRYAITAFVPLALAVFESLRDRKELVVLETVALVSSMSVLSMLPFRPKLIVGYLIVFGLYWVWQMRKNKLLIDD